MIKGNLYFQPVDELNCYYHDALVTSAVKSDGHATVLFAGEITEFGYQFDGKLHLELSLKEQTISDVYWWKDSDTPEPQKNNFTLTGRFAGPDFATFEGTWIEPGEPESVWVFSIQDLKLT